MLHPTFPFKSERLIYRPVEAGDKQWLFDLRQDEAQMRYVPFGGESWEEMDEVVRKRMSLTKLEAPGDGIMCMTIDKASGARAGEVMLRWPKELEGTGEVGFILHPDYQGKGFAHEGAQQMLRLGFEGAGFERMIGICDPANTASKGLLLRLGMAEDVALRDQMFEGEEREGSVVCAMLAETWRAQPGS